ncbi:MAG: ABC transporter substrate-binding protein, partial [Psychrobacillus psychrodurans]
EDNGKANSNAIEDTEVNSPGVTDNEIVVGQIGAQSGNYGVYDYVRQGLQAYFNYVNDEGGINGRNIKLVAYDDKFETKTTLQMAKRLEENDKVFAFVGNVGTIQTLAIKDYLKQNNIPLVGVASGAKVLFDPADENIFGNVVNYTIEVDVLIDYLVKEKGVKKLFVSYLDTDAGKETLDGVERALERHPDLEVVGKEAHLPTDTDFSTVAQKIKQSGADSVIVGSGPSTTANLKKDLYKLKLEKLLFATSSTGGDDPNLFTLVGEDIWNGTISTTSLLSEKYSEDSDINIYMERMEKDFPDAPKSGFTMWGWAMGQIFAEGVKQSGDTLTRESLKQSLEALTDWSGSLYPSLTYSKENHFGNTTIYITEAKDGEIVPITGQITFDVEKNEIMYK